MAIVFTYTESTNTVVVTGGTEGTPATMADFVAADRSNSASLLAAITAAAGVVLTYPVRPVEQKALRLDIITAQNGGAVASGDESIDIYGTNNHWTTFSADEASGQTVLSVNDASYFRVGDVVRLIDISAPATTEIATISAIDLTVGANTITVGATSNAYVSGDIVGINQTETIDTSGGHGAFVTVFSFGQIAYIDCNGYDGTNTVAVDQPIWGTIWDIGNGQYKIDIYLRIGDSSIATYFSSQKELVTFANDKYNFSRFAVFANAVLRLGILYSTNSVYYGSTWAIEALTNSMYPVNYGTLLLYGSVLKRTVSYAFNFWGTYTFISIGSRIEGNSSGNTASLCKFWGLGATSLTDTVFSLWYYVTFSKPLVVATNLTYYRVSTLIADSGAVYIINSLIYNLSQLIPVTNYAHLGFINSNTLLSPLTKWIGTANQVIADYYEADVKVVDVNGDPVVGASVTIKDENNNIVSGTKLVAFLNDHLTVTETGATFTDVSEFTDADVLRIGTEYVDVTDVTGLVATITRAFYGADYVASVWDATHIKCYVVGALSTDANGEIETQLMINKYWQGTSEIEYPTSGNGFVFSITISKSGYETLVIPNITIDSKIDWTIKLKPKVRFDLEGNPYAMVGDKNIMKI